MSKANELFDLHIKLGSLEDDVFYEVLEYCGIDKDDVDVWPFKDWSYDYYDASFEFYMVNPGWQPTFEQFQKCWELGFERCWINYTDNTQRYFWKNMSEREYKKVKSRWKDLLVDENNSNIPVTLHRNLPRTERNVDIWYAEHPTLLGCHATGSSKEEALENLEKSRKAWWEVHKKLIN